VVLGAGLTGLSFSYHFDGGVPIYEREAQVGGLCRTVSVNGCNLDLAPHLLHFRSDEIRQFVLDELGVQAKAHLRDARIHFDGRLIPYPFELNLYHTRNQIRDACLEGLACVATNIREDEQRLRAGSYHDYAYQAFGPGISDYYLLPYNRKIWDTDPNDMTCEWMRRLPTADLEKIRHNAFEPNRDAFGYNTQFYYPIAKGIQDLPDAFAARLDNIHLSHRAVAIDTRRKVVSFDSGSSVSYGKLVSTIPLKSLAQLTAVPHLIEMASQLVSTTVYVVNVVMRGNVPENVHWIYFPDSDVEFYRISLPCHFFERAAPQGQHIIAAEVGSRISALDVGQLEQTILEQLEKVEVFSFHKILHVHTAIIPHAYSIYDRQRTAIVNQLQAELKKLDIISTGRFGRWEYSAMEDAIVYGRNLARQMR